MKGTLESLVHNLDRGFYHEVAARQKQDPSVTAYGYFAELARQKGLAPSEKDLEYRVYRFRKSMRCAPDSKKDHYVRKAAADTWALEQALEQQGIKALGPDSHTADKFFTSAASTVLFPAWVETHAVMGLLQNSLVPALVTQEFNVNSHLVQHVRLQDGAADRRTALSAEGARSPMVRLKPAEAAVPLKKYQAELQASYEALRLQRLQVVALFLQRVGAQVALDETDDLLDVAIAGDGNPGSAVVDTDATVSGTVDYKEIVRLSLAFERGYELRDAVLPGPVLQTLLTLPEFKDPQAGFRYQSTGEVPTFLGAQWHRWTTGGSSAFGTDRILAVDSRRALVQYTEQPLQVESDRLIDRQFERTVVSKWTGFGKPVSFHSPELRLVVMGTARTQLPAPGSHRWTG